LSGTAAGENPRPFDLQVFHSMFDLRGVGFSVPGRTILQPLDLSLEPGRVYGLIGPNGSGKSTLIKMLARQTVPSCGEIRVEGKPLGEWGHREFARRVAYMPQFAPSSDGMNVRELVALGRFPWHGTLGRFGEDDAQKVEDAIARTGIEAMADRAVHTLSGGERQRVWMALMLAQDTACILLDEPTSALDIAQEGQILSLVREISRERGVTILVVLHDINLAARTCDALVALRDGRLIAHAAADDVMRAEVLGEIYGVPMGVMPHPSRDEKIGYVL
jgi:ferric hydroxamate transport system ATP-binding protein